MSDQPLADDEAVVDPAPSDEVCTPMGDAAEPAEAGDTQALDEETDLEKMDASLVDTANIGLAMPALSTAWKILK